MHCLLLVLLIFIWHLLVFPPIFGLLTHVPFVYSRHQLLALLPVAVLPVDRHDIPREFRRKKRGVSSQEGPLLPEKETIQTISPFHTVVMGNVISLPNKMDELRVLTQFQTEYWQCSIMTLTEIWLRLLTSDTSVALPGLQLLWADRMRVSGKEGR